ncbi:DEAD/DEAH box helicase [Aromatoleum bremense]|uniref:Type III restriction endonuclease subunit R n=1 Tax=Aromatoleum bremense TaxID=76115 RepID=A0ABX1P177_9RHOO|nr:DEAD/DEAH box helicase family protein [Aromatoleum bremense]NMG17402.1 type III restriction endonuclease subunit R [Aromatoleum bremense]QTQ31350.1 Putative type III restriction endonuclease [Aromatoleum bremense]
MSLENIVRSVSGRLSLREPQAESLRRLHWAVDQVPALRDAKARSAEELKAMQDALAGQFPTLADFERDFPSLCFALATGVGKTRLMGAFISYLHAAYGYRHFFVLAPNLTIYDKLIGDFSPNSPKYVFKGIAEFASTPPEVITGDNYEQRGSLSLLGGIEVNIFNISKINSEVRGAQLQKRSPKIKRLSEYLGQSYFEYLAGLDDLVLIMDESHRYRASAGIRSLNELRPLLGLELTATPFVEGTGGRTSVGKTIAFKNVVMDYPLARAIEDGFVKEPAVVTQQNFDPSAHSAGALETIKLQDGVRVHEETKVHLLNYYQNSAQQPGSSPVKPFMLVIARDTTHAAQLMATIESNDFFGGRYKGKVIQVDSSRSGAEEEEMIRRLLAVESYDEPTEIVIHVNMLKEGWDVTNLYTIVPLRAANARTLIEQSIGRGLRLPYGRKTGVDVVDRLNIIAHDKFQEVIDEAGRGDSPIRMQALVLTPDTGSGSTLKSISVQPTANAMLGTLTAGSQQVPGANAGGAQYGTAAPTTVFKTDEQRQIAQVAMDVIAEISRERQGGQPFVASTQALTQASIQQQITQRVQERMLPKQGDLLGVLASEGRSPVADIVQKTVAVLVEHTIDIPRILVKPKGPVKSGYKAFKLDLSKMNFQPQDMALVGQGLKTGKQVLYGQSSTVLESQLENYIVRELINYDDVSYDEHAELIYALAGQAVAHFKTYLQTDDELHNILGNYGKTIAENIHLQMALHYYEDISESEIVISQGFTPLKHCAFTAEGDILPLHQAPDEKGKIAQYVYGGFSKCAYPVQKFHSDTERVLACVLERDALRWFRPVAGQFNIYYRSGANQPEYVPDFVAATADHNLIIETKAAKDMEAGDVKAKADAAATWCKNASEYSRAQGGKPWKYLLVPHDAVAHNATVTALAGRYSLSLS